MALSFFHSGDRLEVLCSSFSITVDNLQGERWELFTTRVRLSFAAVEMSERKISIAREVKDEEEEEGGERILRPPKVSKGTPRDASGREKGGTVPFLRVLDKQSDSGEKRGKTLSE